MTAGSTSVVRLGLGALGVAGVGYGLLLLVGLPPDQTVAVVVWAAGGVVLHDGVLAPAVVVLGVVAATRLPAWSRVPLVRLLVVVGPLTLLAVPVLGRFGARTDNPSLLDRPYWLGYGLLLAVAAVLTAADAWRRRRAVAQAAHRPGPG